MTKSTMGKSLPTTNNQRTANWICRNPCYTSFPLPNSCNMLKYNVLHVLSTSSYHHHSHIVVVYKSQSKSHPQDLPCAHRSNSAVRIDITIKVPSPYLSNYHPPQSARLCPHRFGYKVSYKAHHLLLLLFTVAALSQAAPSMLLPRLYFACLQLSSTRHNFVSWYIYHNDPFHWDLIPHQTICTRQTTEEIRELPCERRVPIGNLNNIRKRRIESSFRVLCNPVLVPLGLMRQKWRLAISLFVIFLLCRQTIILHLYTSPT